MHVVATAGHVDHGKSALVRALTGMEPDRWEEERRRGLTLDLGFVWFRPVEKGEHLAFVDVPGHESLVGNMLAGVGPVPAVLFVVAADQGWQPQSEEHLQVLDALGVRHGVLAVTRSDLADPRPVHADAVKRLAGTSLGTVEAVDTSVVSGAGLDALRAALVRLTRSLPPPDPAADVRLWVDRAFTVRGRGTVVTGTLAAGAVRVGDHLLPAGGERPLRVRGLQTLKQERDEVTPTARIALNLHGPGAESIGRGDALVTPGRYLVTETVDVRLHGDPADDDLPRHLTLHAGSASVPVAVRPLGTDTARLSLARALPLRLGDRALLRDPGRHRVPAGVTVLDVRPPQLRRRGAAAARAHELATQPDRPDGLRELHRRGLVTGTELRAAGVEPPCPPVAGDWYADPELWAGLRARLAEAVEQHAAGHPLAPGLPTEAARRRLDLPDRALVDALAATPGASPLTRGEGRIHGASGGDLPPELRRVAQALRQELAGRPFRAPEADRLAELGLDARLLAAGAAKGVLLRLADGIVLLPGADAEAARILARIPGPFTLSEARQALDTTRRTAVPLLEHLDRRGWTERVDAVRRRCRGAGRTGGGPEPGPQ